MKQTAHHVESRENGAALYMALELSAQRWQLAFGLGLATPSRRRTIDAGDRKGLQREIAAAKQRFDLPPTAAVRSCYEAGRRVLGASATRGGNGDQRGGGLCKHRSESTPA